MLTTRPPVDDAEQHDLSHGVPPEIVDSVKKICPLCRRACDDSGQWHHSESLLSDYANWIIQHNYCPDCLQREDEGRTAT